VKHSKYLDDSNETMEGISEATEVNGTKGLTVMSIHAIVEKCHDAFEGCAPEVIDHRKQIILIKAVMVINGLKK
jgi:hypothetical protein